MNLTGNIVLNAYSILLLVIIYVLSLKQEEKESLQNKVYIYMVKSTMLLLIVDVMGRFDGKPDTIYFFINHIGNYLVFILNLSVPSFWLLYVYLQMKGKEANTKRLIGGLVGINIFYIAMVSFSLPYGLFYSINSENIYQRGPFYPFIVLGTVAMMIAAYVIIIRNRNEIEKKQYYALAFFALPPALGTILQILIYGTAFMLNSAVLSLLVIYLNIQNQSIHSDYLTGISNRKKLDTYLRKKISTSNEKQTFAGMMIDLNDFKKINDEFGHDVGDNALKTATRILCSCLRFSDFIARFG
ncbi:MAG: diguanylate cyclase, partial [Lachnospiraceae bacterium]|nr:diguanylate cyclase [Lachnospiraceae bacterium]